MTYPCVCEICTHFCFHAYQKHSPSSHGVEFLGQLFWILAGQWPTSQTLDHRNCEIALPLADKNI